MVFSDFYKKPRSPLAKLRHHHPDLSAQLPSPAPGWLAADYADLLSKDKAKQKEAVKRYLSDKVKCDWQFDWPSRDRHAAPAQTAASTRRAGRGEAVQAQDESRDGGGYQADEGSELEDPSSDDGQDGDPDGDPDGDSQSVYSVVSEDAVHYRPRMEWTSDLSDDDASASPPAAPAAAPPGASPVASPGASTQSALDKRAARRRALRAEMTWNDGLACFEARRNAWTGAKTVRIRSKPTSPPSASPRSPRRFFFRHSMSGSPPAAAPIAAAPSPDGSSDVSSLARDSDKDLKKQRTQASAASDPPSPRLYPVETLLPIGQPLLPPTNPLRASITPSAYAALYDKVVLNSLQPTCPVNLADMLRSCVAGWKRDGEWPPRPSVAEPVKAACRKKTATTSASEHGGSVARRMSFGLLGRKRDDEPRPAKGIRRSLQRALGIGLVPASLDGIEGDRIKAG